MNIWINVIIIFKLNIRLKFYNITYELIFKSLERKFHWAFHDNSLSTRQ